VTPTGVVLKVAVEGTADASGRDPGLAELARLGVSLRWRLVRNRARRAGRRSPWLSMVIGVVYMVGTVAGLLQVRHGSDALAAQRIVLQVSSLVFGWVFGPILIGGVDETVDPTRLALLPLRRGQMFWVQAVAALTGVGPLAASVGMLIGIPAGFAHDVPSAMIAILAAVAVVCLVLGLARSVAALLALAQRTRVGRDLGILLAAFLGGALFVVAQLTANMGGRRAARLVGWLEWTPWGWAGRAVVHAREGSIGPALGWLALAFAAAVVALVAWAQLSHLLLVTGERSARSAVRSADRAMPRAHTVFTAALSRQWIYVRRSPNTRVALLFGTAFGVAFPILQILQHGSRNVEGAAFGVLLAMLVNIGAAANLLGFDAGSLWIEILCGGPRREHMVARSIAVLPNLLVPTWIAAAVIGVWTGTARYVLIVAAVAVPVALIVLAEGMVTSIIAGWPLPDGDNPFGNRQASDGRGGRLAAVALGGLITIVGLASPIVGAAYVLRDGAGTWVAVAVGLLWAVGIDLAVVRWTERRLRCREPELLSHLAPLALN
jgi:ABC-2 type transport system permease protein